MFPRKPEPVRVVPESRILEDKIQTFLQNIGASIESAPALKRQFKRDYFTHSGHNVRLTLTLEPIQTNWQRYWG